ncbi:MAG: hypothetical protein ABR529_03040 [Actinomycetota bacterium]
MRFHHYDAETGRRIRYRRVATGPAPELAAPPVEDVETARQAPSLDGQPD